ncbi:(R)-mandelonitrile lyase-like [Cryptomeria japonica]|uniref:(R)-mandelonitrile lyase-like n=1 Tax=Cryptomeria japonica TaxID=3369 RepID=UPI0027DA6711|nr:(R)-mandelonitrile lyase-like [Cryptomeria japonica]
MSSESLETDFPLMDIYQRLVVKGCNVYFNDFEKTLLEADNVLLWKDVRKNVHVYKKTPLHVIVIVQVLITMCLVFAEYPYPFMTADAKKAAAREYDYIVVGGGTAGCPLAATLSQNYSVLVLERGDSPYGNPDVEDFKGFFKLLGSAKNYPYVAQGFVSEDGVQSIRARVLGGGTAINFGFYSRASSDYIRKMKWDEKLVNESYEWVEKSSAFKQHKLFTWNSAFKDALLEARVVPYNGYTLDHLQGTKISASTFDHNGKRHTAADLLKYANPDNIVVLLNATDSPGTNPQASTMMLGRYTGIRILQERMSTMKIIQP